MNTGCQYRTSDEYAAPRPSAGVFDSPVVPLCINTEWLSHLDGLLDTLLCPAHWEGTETEVETVIQQVQILMAKLGDIQECPTVTDPKFIGEVFMAATEAAPPNSLPCDGGTYDRFEYPALWAVLDPSLKGIDGTTFRTPNLKNGRVPAGTGAWQNSAYTFDDFNVGDEAGQFDHTLTVNQLPAHSHPRNSSGTTENAIRPVNGGYAISSGSNRALETFTDTGQRGGGQAHNNVQPITGMKFFIYAGA